MYLTESYSGINRIVQPMTAPQFNKERFHLLCELLKEFDLHAIGKKTSHLFVSFEEVCGRVLYGFHDQANKNGGSMVKVEGGNAVVLHGEFNVVDILDSAITNNRLTASHKEKMETAIAKYGSTVCDLCYGEKTLSFWVEQPKPKIGYEQEKRPCPICNGSLDDLGEESE